MPTLSSSERVAFDRQRDAVDLEYSTNVARNAAARGQNNFDEQTAVGNLGRQYQRGRNKLPGGFAGRGLLNSGIYRGAVSDFGEAGFDQLSNLRNSFQRNRTELFGQLSAFDANRAIKKADIGLNQATRRSAIASVLQGVG